MKNGNITKIIAATVCAMVALICTTVVCISFISKNSETPTADTTGTQQQTTAEVTVVQPDYKCGGVEMDVDVTPPYDGEPLNMRSGPAKEYAFITFVPDGAKVHWWGSASATSEWIYVEYEGHYGWVLSKYVLN